MASMLFELDSLQCKFVAPDVNASAPNAISRWSDTNIGQPALVVTPKTEDDVKDAIRVAKANSLNIVAACGGHGTFTPVDSQTLYLDLCMFKAMELNETDGTVLVGGGVNTGELVKYLAVKGYYTPVPNCNAVGVVGGVIGGGNTPLSGLHGWMADVVTSFRLVTSGGNIIEVSSLSKGDDLDLFNALCGAGHGLGVITAITTIAYPISCLNMTEDRFWLRSLVFPAAAIEEAAQAFVSLSQPSPLAINSITFARSPPGTPMAGTPIIIVGGTFFGPVEQAETESAILIEEKVVSKAVNTTTDMIPMASINDRFRQFEAHGGQKSIASCKLNSISVDTIKNVFSQWLSATEKYPDAQSSPLLISSQNPSKQEHLGRDKTFSSRFIESRERGIMGMFISIRKNEDTLPVVKRIADDLMAEFRKDQEGAPRSFPNNMRFGISLEELFDSSRLVELRDLKKKWDADGVFWSPYTV